MWATLVLVPAAAQASGLSAGAELGLMLKAEADGRHTARPELGLRVEYGVGRFASVEALYAVSHAREGARFFAASWQHGLDLRASAVLALPSSRLLLGVGPAARVASFDLYDRDARVASHTHWSLGASAGLAVLASVRGLEARFGVDSTWLRSQLDWRLTVGVLLPIGGGR